MNTYKNYLQKENYSPSSIENYDKQITFFLKWCKRNNTTASAIDYKTFLKYLKHLQRKKLSKKTVSHKVGIIKSYFKYLLIENYRVDNPVESIQIQGVKRVTNYNLLEAEELEDLYYSFETDNYQNKYQKQVLKRSKVLVGLIVYQGLNVTDLASLKIEHLQLTKGKIYVPSTKRGNARELELKPWQMMEFMAYVNEVRPMIQNSMNNHSDQLFTTNGRFSSMIHELFKKLRRYNQKVANHKQVRASVITNWLGQYNLRKVQYLAGHRYISSTEKYVQDDLENLHEIVNNFHPIS